MNWCKIFKMGKYILIIYFSVMVLWLMLRVFIGDYYPVNTSSMSPTILPGDKIWVNKRIFGARLYTNLHFSKEAPLQVRRLKGRRGIRRDDIVVFNAPVGKQEREISFMLNYVYVKRCIALPGDTLSIRNGLYEVAGYTGIIYTKHQKELLNAVFPLEVHLYPQDSVHAFWTMKDYGPLYIPKKGDTMHLDEINWSLYVQPIMYETQQKLTLKDGMFYLGGQDISDYVFTHNYYFFCGDNVLNSFDSRYFGFVPETFIIGVSNRVLYNTKHGRGRGISGYRVLQRLL
jgi:signal peptidase I, bacterial type